MKLNRYKSYKQKSNALVGLIPLRESELNNLEKELLLASNLHSYLSQKKEEALINLSSLQSNIKLINNVNYILESKTNKPRTLSFFLLAGFMLPVGFSLCLFFLRGFCVDIEYLKKELTNCNFLGIVKYSKEIASKEIKSVQYELFKRIYHNINMLIPKSEKGMSIMITSCIKNEGKTFTAFNLSTFLASTGKKVVLIGTDLGNPDLSKLFDQKNNNCKGLTNIIHDTKNNFEELFDDYKTTNNQLDTLFVGTKNSTKINVYDTKRFDDLISYLKEKYDYIIFDSAPILFMVDSLELLEKSDYVVHVFRKNFSSKKLVNYVLDYKEKYNKKNLGYVITDDSKPDKFIDKYGYRYGYGYGYGYGYR
jgi:capsular exopolysaccharide synthesis family protein